jgi:tetratricopeptide (TPR) repeat protein
MAATAAPPVPPRELTAQDWFERGYRTAEADEKLQCYDEAIRLKPDYADAYNNRGIARRAGGDLAGALKDYDEAIRLKPDYALAYNNRGIARRAGGDLAGAETDFAEAHRLRAERS